jgi:hypothetical protein
MDGDESAFLQQTQEAFILAKENAIVLDLSSDQRLREVGSQLNALKAKQDLPNEIVCAVVQGHLALIAFLNGSRCLGFPDMFLCYEWPQPFKPLKTASFFWKGGPTMRAYLFIDEPFLGLLEDAPTLFVIAHKFHVQFAFQIDLGSAAKIEMRCGKHREEHYVDDALAAKLYSHVYAGKWGESPREKLTKSYVDRLVSEIRTAIRLIETNKDQQNIVSEKEAAKKTFFGEYYASPHYYRHIYNFFRNKLTEENPSIVEWLFKIRTELAGLGKGFLADQATHLFTCALYSPTIADFGLCLPSHDLENNFERVSLDPEAMGPRAEQFWLRLPWTVLSFYREVIGTPNCPVDPVKFLMEAPVFEGNLEEAEALADNLLTEAVELKQATIPPEAYHPIGQGSNIHAVKLFELGPEVAAVFADSYGDFFQATCNPRERTVAVRLDYLGFSVAQALTARAQGDVADPAATAKASVAIVNDKIRRFESGIKLFLATLIRDFWVLEEREQVFGASRLVKKVPKLNADRSKPVLVYLPRVRYVRRFREEDAHELNYNVRAPHWVREHLRKSTNPSEERLAVARSLGVFVPEGFTFVRRHRRGDKAAEVSYRSVSALRCFRMVQGPKENAKDAWFQFERNTAAWLKGNGYEIEHL